jgi:hypothetical protein
MKKQTTTKCKSNSFMVENCSGSSHIQPRQIFDLTDLVEKIWLFGRFEDYRFENRYYFYISRCHTY